ncbi:MAG: YqgE/AlgH family protein [Acidimicrobiales bacterium]
MSFVSAPTRGRLLVAGPPLEDPNFRRTVVFMIEHNEEGALGVVLNRPSPIDLADAVPQWADLAANPPAVFIGGPVEQGAVLGLGRLVAEDPPEGLTPVHAGIGVLDLEADPVRLVGDVGGVRLFTGYSGWGPGQLEDEVAMGGWFVVDAEPDDVTTTEPDDLWRAVLRRQPDDDLARLALFPDDLSAN